MIKRLILDGAAMVGVALALTACTGSKDAADDTSDTDSGTDSADTNVDTDSGIDTADTGDTGTSPAGDAVLLGRVTDNAGAAIEGATVTLDSGETTQSNAEGLFRIENLGTGDAEETVRAIATFSKDGFMGSTRIFDDLNATDRTWQVSMIPRAAGQTFDAASTIDVRLTFGTDGSLTIHPGTLVDENGAAATGQATAYLTMIDVADDVSLRAAPGDFSAQMSDGNAALLESWGMAELLVLGADGKELQLAAGTTAEVAMPLVFPRIGRDQNPGQAVPFLWFDEAAGVWMQEGEAVLSPEGGLMIGDIDRFDHWNSDKPMETTCVSAHVEDATGPRENLQVEAMGLDYTNYSDHFTSAAGDAYMLVRRDSTLSFTVYDADGTELATMNATTPNTIGDCQSLLDAGQLQEVASFTL